MLPERIGRYEVVRLAGSGGFATVYEGLDPRLDAPVAIKVLAENWAADPEIRRRFRQEAVLLRRMRTEHEVPGLVEVFDIDETPSGQPFFVMGWAGGGTLSDRADRRPWSPEDLRPVIVALTQSVGHLHARGLVHRDIKPQNILLRSKPGSTADSTTLVGPDERLVLSDFGLAKDLAASGSSLSFVGGTARYMAPEQLVFGGSVDHRADIFAATAMVAELLTGVGEQAGVGEQELSPAFQAVVDKGTASAPVDRFDNMADWQNAFLDAIDSSAGDNGLAREMKPPVVGGAAPDEVGSRPSDGLPIGRIAVVVIALAVVLAAAVVFAGSGETIRGPATIESGATATYSVEEQSGIEWISPSGSRTQSPTLDVTGRLPGELTISAIVNGDERTRTIQVLPSALGPTIDGPAVVRQGNQGVYRADVPAGHTFYWVHPTRGQVSAEELTIAQDGTEFVVGLISIDQDGVERGDQMLVASQ